MSMLNMLSPSPACAGEDIELGQADLVVDLVVQGMLETPRQELSFQIDSEKPRTSVNVLVAGHAGLLKPNARWSLDIPFGSRQDAAMMRVFLQLRYAARSRRAIHEECKK